MMLRIRLLGQFERNAAAGDPAALTEAMAAVLVAGRGRRAMRRPVLGG